jgi:zinc/manganese transport system permease protein
MDAWFVLPALALAVGLVALAPLGAQVLARGVVFIDLAVAQAAAAGSLAAAVIFDHPDALATQAAASLGALAGAAAVAALARRWPAQREALIGLVYVAGACAAVLTARADPHGRERLLELLAADLLWAGAPQVAMLGAFALAVTLLDCLAPGALRRNLVFYPVFALVGSVAVPVLGVFVVFAALISPALWQHAGHGRGAALTVAGAAGALGLACSWVADAPSGACVALALAAAGIGTLRRQPSKAAASLPGR